MKAFLTVLCLLILAWALFVLGHSSKPAAPPLAAEVDVTGSSQIAKLLGPLTDNLIAAFSMDGSNEGSMVYARPTLPLAANFFGTVRWVNDAGRQCASFAQPGAMLSGTLTSAALKTQYTLATWMKFPVPSGFAVVWEGPHGPLLAVKEGKFICGREPDIQTFCDYAPIPGWHHVAVTGDGLQMCFFFDGELKGTASHPLEGEVNTVGRPAFGNPAEGQCDCLDDMFVFDRPLNPQEIAKLGAVRLPVHPPSPSDLAHASSALPSTPPVSRANPSPNDVAAETAKLVSTYRNSLVFVAGQNGSGSGFLATYANGNYLVTNVHVAARLKGATFKTLDDERIQIGAASAAVGHDIFLMQAVSTGKPFETMKAANQEAAIGDDVVVLGNAEGAGVINTIGGKIVGFGPNLVEVDAPFVPGNSGSPIIHLKTGKVIGVASYALVKKFDSTTKLKLGEPEVRRFGYRLDSVKVWQPINWAAFSEQALEMEKIEVLTGDLVKFVNDLSSAHRITPGLHTNPVIKSRVDAFESELRPRMSEKDIAAASSNLVAYLKSACRADILAAQNHFTYDYFQRKLADEQRDRTKLADIFEHAIQEIRSSAAR